MLPLCLQHKYNYSQYEAQLGWIWGIITGVLLSYLITYYLVICICQYCIFHMLRQHLISALFVIIQNNICRLWRFSLNTPGSGSLETRRLCTHRYHHEATRPSILSSDIMNKYALCQLKTCLNSAWTQLEARINLKNIYKYYTQAEEKTDSAAVWLPELLSELKRNIFESMTLIFITTLHSGHTHQLYLSDEVWQLSSWHTDLQVSGQGQFKCVFCF